MHTAYHQARVHQWHESDGRVFSQLGCRPDSHAMASPPTDFAPQSYTMMPCYMPDTFAPIQPALPPPLMKADVSYEIHLSLSNQRFFQCPVAQNCARIASKGHLMSQVTTCGMYSKAYLQVTPICLDVA